MDPVVDHRYERAPGSKPQGLEGFFRALLSGRLLRIGSHKHSSRRSSAMTSPRCEEAMAGIYAHLDRTLPGG